MKWRCVGTTRAFLFTRVARTSTVPYRVLPNEHSTWPSSAPNESVCARASRNSRPSRRRFWSSAAKKKSFSGIEGDGGRMDGREIE